MSKSWFQIQAKAEGNAEVFIYDEIGAFGVTAKDFIAQMRDTKAKNITVRINSAGGSVFDGLAIYNYLKGAKNVTVQIDGIAASIASIIAMGGKRVCMAANGFLMIHNPSGGCMGESGDMREMANVLDKIAASLAQTYAAKTGKTPEECAAWMNDESWFDAEQAKAAGLIDEICDASVFTAKLDDFKKTPVALTAGGTKTISSTASTSTETIVVNIQPQQPIMDKLIKALADAKLIEAATNDEAKVVEQFSSNLTSLHNELVTLKDSVKTKDADLTAKDEELKALRADADARRKADATAQVNAALAAGKIKADSVDTWVAKMLTDKDAAALLAGLPTAVAGVEPVKAKVQEKVTNLTGLQRALAAHKAAYASENNN